MNSAAPSLVMPNFKPTKWRVDTCQDCFLKALKDEHSWYKENGIPDIIMSWSCGKEGHNIIQRDNMPFFIPDMQIVGIGYKGWINLKSNMGKAYSLGPTKLQEVIFNAIIDKGHITNQWWMYCKLGSSMSVRLVQ